MPRFTRLVMIIFLLIIFFGFHHTIMAESQGGTKEISVSYIVVISVLSLATLGFLFGCGLGMASKVFEVETDPKIMEINELLPQIQCGMCGQAGCSAFAESVVKGESPPDGCRPGGVEIAQQIGEIMGVKIEMSAPPIATVLCTRKKDVKQIQQYAGIRDCRAATSLGSNIYACAFACLGMGTCKTVCPFDAIYMNDEDMPIVMADRCTGCGLCVQECPVNILRLTPRDRYVHILCASTEMAKIKAKVHKPGACIACRKCVKTCPENAISIVNNVAIIDYEKCTCCEACIAVCPTKAIFNLS